MSDLTAAYDRLARGWTHEQLAGRYRDAKRRGEQQPECDQDHLIRRPIAMLASAVPACASLSVTIHVIHVLPATRALAPRDQLLRNAENNSAVALYRCHKALELDGQAHDYTADEWLPAIYDIAAPLLEAARLNREPPSLVEQAQDAVRWLSRAIVEVDEDTPTPRRPSWTDSDTCSRCTSSRTLPARPQTNPGRSLIALLSRFRPWASPSARCACLGRGAAPPPTLRRPDRRKARADPTALQRVLVGGSDRTPAPSAVRILTTGSSPKRSAATGRRAVQRDRPAGDWNGHEIGRKRTPWRAS